MKPSEYKITRDLSGMSWELTVFALLDIFCLDSISILLFDQSIFYDQHKNEYKDLKNISYCAIRTVQFH